MPDIEILLLLLFFVAVLAGWVDTLAGGGGLLTIPAMLLAGMEPSVALATNKLQGSMGTLVASRYFIRKKMVNIRDMKAMIFCTFVGSILGSWLLLQLDARKLAYFLPVFLVVIGIYVLLSPQINDEQKKQKLSIIAFSLLVCPVIGFYDGFFGPGTGSFMALAFVTCLGYGLSNATAQAKILNFTSNISALGYFILFGEIDWMVGAVMIAGQYIGATLGAKMVISKGAKLIKPIVVSVCFLMSINILIRQLLA